jgi:hypothetical protein
MGQGERASDDLGAAIAAEPDPARRDQLLLRQDIAAATYLTHAYRRCAQLSAVLAGAGHPQLEPNLSQQALQAQATFFGDHLQQGCDEWLKRALLQAGTDARPDLYPPLNPAMAALIDQRRAADPATEHVTYSQHAIDPGLAATLQPEAATACAGDTAATPATTTTDAETAETAEASAPEHATDSELAPDPAPEQAQADDPALAQPSPARTPPSRCPARLNAPRKRGSRRPRHHPRRAPQIRPHPTPPTRLTSGSTS